MTDGCKYVLEGKKAQKFISDQIMKVIEKKHKNKNFRRKPSTKKQKNGADSSLDTEGMQFAPYLHIEIFVVFIISEFWME